MRLLRSSAAIAGAGSVDSAAISWPIQNPTAGGISIGGIPLTQLILGSGNGLTDAQVAVTSVKGRNAYEQSSTDKPGSALILSGGIGRRFVTIVDWSLIDSGVDTVTLTLGSVSTGSYVSTATVITAGTGWVPATSNAVTAAALATYLNTLGLSITATASGSVCYIAPKPDLISFTLATTMSAGEGTVTSGTDGQVLAGVDGTANNPAYSFASDTDGGMCRLSNNVIALCGSAVVIIQAASNDGGGAVHSLWFGTNSGSSGVTNQNTRLAALTTASLVLGKAANATPVAQIFTIGEASRPGTDTNVGGASGTIVPGLGTGTGAAPSLTLRGVVLTGSGSGVQSYQDMVKITGVALGFYNATPVALQTGVAVSAAGVHAALVNLGLITA